MKTFSNGNQNRYKSGLDHLFGRYTVLKALAVIASASGLICLFVSVYFLYEGGDITNSHRINLDKASKIGDFIGGFTGIFWTIAGVILLFLTLRMQADEFRDNRHALIKQQFESSFFNMLNILSRIRSELSIPPYADAFHNDELKGDQFFESLNSAFYSDFENAVQERRSADEIAELREKISNLDDEISSVNLNYFKLEVSNISTTFLRNNDDKVGHYFRFFESIVNVVVSNRSKFGDVDYFLMILRNQLSSEEISFLFYAGLSSYNQSYRRSSGIYHFLNIYKVLEAISLDGLIHRSDHILYSDLFPRFLSNDEAKHKVALSKKIE